ncbi:MAG: hypothetical protein KDA86_15990 [Planctomycetaceae bacterium]|nr:hypothetical protein [Planctomycetaceae bacterium]
MLKSSSGVERLKSLATGSSHLHELDARSMENRQFASALPARSSSWFNLPQFIRQTLRMGKAETDRFDSRLDAIGEVEIYHDQSNVVRAKHAIDVQRIVVEERVQHRGLEELKTLENEALISRTDAVEIVAFYADRTIGRIQRVAKSKLLREMAQETIEMMAEGTFTTLRLAHAGVTFSPASSRQKEVRDETDA